MFTKFGAGTHTVKSVQCFCKSNFLDKAMLEANGLQATLIFPMLLKCTPIVSTTAIDGSCKTVMVVIDFKWTASLYNV